VTERAAPTLRRVLGWRLIGAALAAFLALAVVVGVVYTVQRARLDRGWVQDAQAHFELQTRRLDADWLRQAELLRAQIEFAGLFDGDDRRLSVARFTAFLANLGGQATFTHVTALDLQGGLLASYATRSGTVDLPADRAPRSWSYSDVDGLVYRVIRAPLRIGNGGRGELVLFVPLNNALLGEIAFPYTRLSLHWKEHADLSRSDEAAASKPDGPSARVVESLFPWGGDRDGPELHIYRSAQDLLSLPELLALVAAGVLGGGLLGWLAIGRWSRQHVRRIDGMAAVMDRFAAGREDASLLRADLQVVTERAEFETRRLGLGLGSMMQATQAAHAEKDVANRELSQLNATLEQRVLQRTQELAVARDEALAAAHAREQILAGVSHELRTPLVGLLGSLELIESQPLPPDAQRLIEVSRRSGQALRNVIDDVLDYSRLEAVGADLRQLPFHVGDLAAEAVGLHAAVALNKGLRLDCDCDAGASSVVRGDPVRLRQVLLNLIGNAVKFTDRGEVVLRVRTRLDAADERRPTFRFEVRDSGLGIAEADRARLFSPFVQVTATHRPARGGTGLGLAIAQRLVVAMGGRIELQSEPGAGSTFWFEIPLPRAEAAPQAKADEVLRAPLRGRVLLVEDNPVNRIIASEMLRRMGLEVVEAENGQHAVEVLRRQPVDLVLMDQMMPVLDGAEATARIRAGDAGAGATAVPIVAITANALPGDADRALAAGMDDYLSKPFTQRELEAKLSRWLRAQTEPVSRA